MSLTALSGQRYDITSALVQGAAWTVMCWFKRTAADADYSTIFTRSVGGGDDSPYLSIAADNPILEGSGNAVTSIVADTIGSWGHYAVTSSGGATPTMRVYKDGYQICADTNTYDAEADSTLSFLNDQFGESMAHGKIAYARVWQRAMSQTEILTEMRSAAPAAPACWAAWRGNGTLADSTGNGRDLTMGIGSAAYDADEPTLPTAPNIDIKDVHYAVAVTTEIVGITTPVTVTSGAHQKLVAFVLEDEDSLGGGGPPTTLTYGGVALELSAAGDDNGDVGLWMGYLDNPAPGTASLIAKITGAGGGTGKLAVIACVLTNVDAGDCTASGVSSASGTFTDSLVVPDDNSIVLNAFLAQQADGAGCTPTAGESVALTVTATANNDALGLSFQQCPTAGPYTIGLTASDGAAFDFAGEYAPVSFRQYPAAPPPSANSSAFFRRRF